MRFSSPGRGDPSRAWNWWSDARQGGGVWGAVGSHFVDAVRYLVGEVAEAQAVEKTFITERPFGDGRRTVTSDDFAAVHLRLANGAIAVLSLSVLAAVDEPTTIMIHGESGGIRLEGDQWFAGAHGTWVRQELDERQAPDNLTSLPWNTRVRPAPEPPEPWASRSLPSDETASSLNSRVNFLRGVYSIEHLLKSILHSLRCPSNVGTFRPARTRRSALLSKLPGSGHCEA